MKFIGVLRLFSKEFEIYGDEEEPWFRAKNVALNLHYANGKTSRMMDLVDAEDKVLSEVYNPHLRSKRGVRRRQNEWFMTEFGLYDVLLRSTRPDARRIARAVKEKLRDWRRYGYTSDLELFEDMNFYGCPKDHMINNRLEENAEWYDEFRRCMDKED